MKTHECSPTFVAPSTLTMDRRLENRDAVLSAVALAAKRGAPAVVADLRATTQVDAAGLGVLILLQKRAREHGMRTRLQGVPPEIRTLLDSTWLHTLFDFDSPR